MGQKGGLPYFLRPSKIKLFAKQDILANHLPGHMHNIYMGPCLPLLSLKSFLCYVTDKEMPVEEELLGCNQQERRGKCTFFFEIFYDLVIYP